MYERQVGCHTLPFLVTGMELSLWHIASTETEAGMLGEGTCSDRMLSVSVGFL